MDKPSIFISHAHSDFRLAERIQKVLEAVSGQGFKVDRSSAQGAIKSGENWREWIDDKVLNCDVAIVVLTPGSFRGRWVLWEAGAVAGVQYERFKTEKLSSNDPKARRVRVLQFGLDHADLGPFGSSQALSGLVEGSVETFLSDLLSEFQERLDPAAFLKGLKDVRQTVKKFVLKASDDLRYTAIQSEEGLIQEWVQRIDKAQSERNHQWVVAATRWINVAFLGAENADAHKNGETIDIRLHTRIAASHRNLNDWHGAVAQLQLAARLSPNDLVVLRDLGRAYRATGNLDALEKTMVAMKKLDPHIFTEDREGVALRCGYLSSEGAWVEVDKLLAEVRPSLIASDSYLANWRALASMKVNGAAQSKPLFEQLRQLLAKTGSGFWDDATAVNALIALGEKDAASEKLVAMNLPKRSMDEIDSASRFYDDIIVAFGLEFDWRSAAGLKNKLASQKP